MAWGLQEAFREHVLWSPNADDEPCDLMELQTGIYLHRQHAASRLALPLGIVYRGGERPLIDAEEAILRGLSQEYG